MSWVKRLLYKMIAGVADIPGLNSLLYRLCRHYQRSYDHYSYDFRRNGEGQIIQKFFSLPDVVAPVVFDVWANQGHWTKIVLQQVPQAKIHQFEPTPDTFQTLTKNMETYKGQLQINHMGLSDEVTHLRLNNFGHHSGRNSFVLDPSFPQGQPIEQHIVPVIMAKDYIEKNNIRQIDFLKIDVEGWEYRVLLGFGQYLNPDFISVIQFEYGYASGDNKILMRDFYRLLEERGFKVGRLKRTGVKFSAFDCRMNNFESGPNYVACHPRFIDALSNF